MRIIGYYLKITVNVYKHRLYYYNMDKIIVPASITLENGFSTQNYKWKSQDKISNYRRPCRRAFIRFTCKNFAERISSLGKNKRQISIKFLDNSNVMIRRIKNKNISMQGYSGLHPYVQIIINKYMPKELWKKLEETSAKSVTFPVNAGLDLNDWKDVGLKPSHFLIEVEQEAKSLMERALKMNFDILTVSKGREYDLSLITPNKKEVIIALSSHVAKNKSRSKEKTIQKILMDISKMLPYLDKNKTTVPVIITRPIEFENSWSFTTKNYLDFYETKFGFKFITTEFKKGWEDNIIKELLTI